MGRAFLFVIALQGPGLPGPVVEGGRHMCRPYNSAFGFKLQ